jgi:hypothetical protein
MFMVLDADGKKLAGSGEWSAWPPPIADFGTLIAQAKAMQSKLHDLAGAANGGDAKAAAELLQLQIDLRRVSLAEARTHLGALRNLDDSVKANLQASLVGFEFDEVLASEQLESQEDAVRVGKRLAAMPAGPTGDKAEMFWGLIMQYAESVKDAAQFERAIKGMQALYGEHPNFKTWLERANKKLAAIKQGAGQEPGGDKGKLDQGKGDKQNKPPAVDKKDGKQ